VSLLTRKRVVLGIALIVGALLLGVWVMRAGDSVDGAPRTETQASTHQAALPADAPRTAEQAPSARRPSSALGTFRGRVVDAATGDPVREFEVRLFTNAQLQRSKDAPPARTFRTSDGRFEWTRLARGAWTLVTTARGYQRFVLADVEIANDASPEITLTLRPGHELRGRVYDEVSGAGIAASISFRVAGTGPYEENFRTQPRFESAANGTFVVDGVPPGRMTLEVYAPYYESRDVTVVVGNATAPLEIGLATGGTIAGRLVQADGVTPAKGMVGLSDHERETGVGIQVGAGGEFSFGQLHAGRYQISAQAESGTATRELTLARNQRIEGIVLTVGGGQRIRGVVTGLRADELQRAYVSVHRDDDTWSSSRTSPVDPRGEFVITGVRPGSVLVMAGVTMGRSISKSVDVPASGDVRVAIDFPAGARLSGRVTERGQPVARVMVSPRPSVEQLVSVNGVTTSDEGKYVIEGLAEGEYRLAVDRRYLTRPVLVSRDTVFDIDVPDAQISGRVLEETGEVPIAGVQVGIWPADPGASPLRLRALSDDYGQFALRGLERGDFTLSVYKPGYEMSRQRISYSGPIGDLAIRLRRDAGVEVRVQDAASRQSLRQMYLVETLGKRTGTQMTLHLDDDGVAYIPSALAGSTLTFSVTGYESAIVPAWNGQSLNLQLEQTPQMRQ
jgi:hypothetical protein